MNRNPVTVTVHEQIKLISCYQLIYKAIYFPSSSSELQLTARAVHIPTRPPRLRSRLLMVGWISSLTLAWAPSRAVGKKTLPEGVSNRTAYKCFVVV